MDIGAQAAVIRQHLIDPEICIRCNTCESTCPIGAITHDERNYVVKAGVCDACMACVPPFAKIWRKHGFRGSITMPIC